MGTGLPGSSRPPATWGKGSGGAEGKREGGGCTAAVLRRLFQRFREGTSGGAIHPKSKELWALSTASCRACLPWLAQDERRRVELALPGLVASRCSGDGAVRVDAFVQTFMDLRRKLKAKQRAEKLLAEAKSLEAKDEHASALSAYQSCLEAAPRNSSAHLGYAMLLRLSGEVSFPIYGGQLLDASRETVQQHLCAAMEFGSSEAESREAALKLAFILCQEGEEQEGAATAAELLLESGFRFRLADPVLRYRYQLSSSTSTTERSLPAPSANSEETKLIAVLEGVMPKRAFKHLQAVFSPTSEFWEEHQYCSYPPSPYFSYLHRLDGEPTSSLDQVIRYVQAKVSVHFPEVADAVCAEWWAHCRPHTHGHQLHFDSDNEGKVLYLSEGTGGPTLMTTQHIKDSRLASRGWLAFPKLNRLVVFDGTYLHGVIPGHGSPEGSEGGRRVTLMVAFWRHQLTERPREDGRPGACIPQPSPPLPCTEANDSTWASALRPLPSLGKAKEPIRVGAQPVQPIWQSVCPQEEADAKSGVCSLKKLPSYDLCFQGF